MKDLTIKIQGHTADTLRFGPNINMCGNIKDGVSLEFDRKGGWVIAFKDLKRMYEAAVKARQ
jgi:hypothetical protein